MMRTIMVEKMIRFLKGYEETFILASAHLLQSIKVKGEESKYISLFKSTGFKKTANILALYTHMLLTL